MPVKINNEAKDKIIQGVNLVCNVVKLTYGAEGATVIMDDKIHPKITKDGYNVAREIHDIDPEVNMGVALIKEVADATVKTAEDGTTTSCILAQSIINKGYELIKNGVSHVEIREGLLKAKDDVLEQLEYYSEDITTDEVFQIALVSANGDEEVAKLIQDAYQHIDSDGLLEVERTTSLSTTLEIVKGIKLNRGWLAPHFMTDSQKLIADLNKVEILLFDGSITNLEKEVLPAIKICQASKTALLVVCDEMSDEVADSLISNKINKVFNSCVVRNPEYGLRRMQILEDLRAFVGGEIYNPKISKDVILGKATKVIVGQDYTLLQQDFVEDTLEPQIQALKAQLSLEPDNKFLEKRISNLSSNGACIYVGGQSTSEIGEKFDRVEDAIGAVKCALEGGVVSGGGSAFLNISNSLSNKRNSLGYNLMLEALRAPYKQILENAGIIEKDSLFWWKRKAIPELRHSWEVYNVKTNKIENKDKNGIKDATKVLKTALSNATSLSILVLSIKGTITV
jgi:chaperonin GroEL